MSLPFRVHSFLPRTLRTLRTLPRSTQNERTLTTTRPLFKASDPLENPPQGNPVVSGRAPPEPPKEESANLNDNVKASSFLGTTKRLPEFNLNDKVILVTGAARGLGLTQAEGLLEAGATG